MARILDRYRLADRVADPFSILTRTRPTEDELLDDTLTRPTLIGVMMPENPARAMTAGRMVSLPR